jgi:toxin ParE1/3/4
VSRAVSFSPEAEADLLNLYDYIADRSGTERALSYTHRIREYCMSFAEFAERGTGRDDLWPGLRIIGFEKRVAIAFHVIADTVIIDRILYGGRDLASTLSDDG